MTSAASSAETGGLVLSGITKSFGPVKVLHDVGFDIRPGELVALLGENGAGKSTVSNIIAGSVKADAGTITWRGSLTPPPGPPKPSRPASA